MTTVYEDPTCLLNDCRLIEDPLVRLLPALEGGAPAELDVDSLGLGLWGGETQSWDEADHQEAGHSHCHLKHLPILEDYRTLIWLTSSHLNSQRRVK